MEDETTFFLFFFLPIACRVSLFGFNNRNYRLYKIATNYP